MTSLIDVIFLLLLFFMLSSTFTRFAELELAAGGTGGGADNTSRPVFLRLSPERLSLNGAERTLVGLPAALKAQQRTDGALPVIVALTGAVTAQRLTDLLATLRRVPGLTVPVLETS